MHISQIQYDNKDFEQQFNNFINTLNNFQRENERIFLNKNVVYNYNNYVNLSSYFKWDIEKKTLVFCDIRKNIPIKSYKDIKKIVKKENKSLKKFFPKTNAKYHQKLFLLEFFDILFLLFLSKKTGHFIKINISRSAFEIVSQKESINFAELKKDLNSMLFTKEYFETIINDLVEKNKNFFKKYQHLSKDLNNEPFDNKINLETKRGLRNKTFNNIMNFKKTTTGKITILIIITLLLVFILVNNKDFLQQIKKEIDKLEIKII